MAGYTIEATVHFTGGPRGWDVPLNELSLTVKAANLTTLFEKIREHVEAHVKRISADEQATRDREAARNGSVVLRVPTGDNG